MPEPIGQVTDWLRRVDPSLDAVAVAEACWLATHAGTEAISPAGLSPSGNDPPDARAKSGTDSGTAERTPEAQQSATPTGPDANGPEHDTAAGVPDATGDLAGHPVRSPARRRPAPRTLAQSMRALKTRWPHGSASQLDLDRTVEQFAATGLLLPVLCPASERWFDVDIVVDLSGSMPAWDATVADFVKVLQELAAFRTIRRWQLSFAAAAPLLRTSAGRALPAGRLRAADHRRLIFVISDFTDYAWYSPLPWRMLHTWAESTATVLVGLLPPKLRHLTKIDVRTSRARPGPPGAPNPQLDIGPTRVGDDEPVPVPLLSLAPSSLRRWADTLMRGDPVGCEAILLPPGGTPLGLAEPDDRPIGANRTVELFELLATREARRIARLASALGHVSVSVLRFVAERMVPASKAADIAEVMVSGLFAMQPGRPDVLEFRPGVRDVLLRQLMTPDAWEILDTLEQYVTENVASQQRFAARPSAHVQPFVAASNQVRTLLGLADAEPPRTESAGADPPTKPQPGSQRRALLIGVQTGGLTGVNNDVDAMAAALSARDFLIQRVTEDQATRAGILAAYRRLIAEASSNDACVVYYSGHGGLLTADSTLAGADAPLPDLSFIVPWDYDNSTDEDFRGITSVELSGLLAELTRKTPNVTIILECGHAAHMSHNQDQRVKALLRGPTRQSEMYASVSRHLDQLSISPYDPVSNPHAVRILACGPQESAYESTNRDGERMGVFTDALTRTLNATKDIQVNWATLLQAIRREVQQHVLSQRPEIEGPTNRLLFQTAELPDEFGGRATLSVVVTDPGRIQLPGAPLLGVLPGDEFAIMPADAAAPDDRRGLGTARVDSLSPMAASAELTLAPGVTRVPEDARAHRIFASAPLLPVRLPLDHPGAGDLRTLITARPLVRVAGPGEDAPVEVWADEQGLLGVRDAMGPLHPPHQATAHGLQEIVTILQRLAQAAALRWLKPEPAEQLEHNVSLEWGRVLPNGGTQPLTRSGALLYVAALERIYIRLDNRGDSEVFVSLIDISQNARISLLTSGDPSGQRIPAGGHYIYGRNEYTGQLMGVALTWPESLDRIHPRSETVLVLISDNPIDVSVLQQAATHSRQDAPLVTSSLLERLLSQAVTGATREVRLAPGDRTRYDVIHVDFTVSPAVPPRTDEPTFLIDDWPTEAAPPLGHGDTRTESVAVRINELTVHRNRAWGSANIRVDTVVLTRGPAGRPAYRANTMRFANIRDGERLHLDNVLIYDGPAVDFIDIAVWVSRDSDGSLTLYDLLAQSLVNPTVQAAFARAAGLADTVATPARAGVGLSAIVMNTAYRELLGAVGITIGVYRTSLLAQDHFGIGQHQRHPQDLSITYTIEKVDGPHWINADDLDAARSAVAHYREMSADNRDAYLPQLAGSVNAYSIRLEEAGMLNEAADASREAVVFYRELAARNPGIHLPELVNALNIEALHLAQVGLRNEALTATAEAVDLYRQLAATDPTFESSLAGTLNSLGNRLLEQGRRDEAIAATAEAADLYRRLAASNLAANAAAFAPDLAQSLNNLGIQLSGLGRREEALTAAIEAVDVYRRLAVSNPAMFEPDLARSRANLAACYRQAGRAAEALGIEERVVADSERILGPEHPDTIRARANLAASYRQAGRAAEALGIEERVVANDLTAPHRQTLQMVADLFRQNDSWPAFNLIDRPLRRQGIDAVSAIMTMPVGLLVRGRGYVQPMPGDPVQLTVRGIALCKGTEQDLELFFAVTRWAAALDDEFDPSNDPAALPRLTSHDVAEQFESIGADPRALSRLYAMLLVQRWGFGSGGGRPDDWWWEIDRDIQRFATVATAEEYDEARAAWVAETTRVPPVGQTAATSDHGPATFAVRRAVARERLDQLGASDPVADASTRVNGHLYLVVSPYTTSDDMLGAICTQSATGELNAAVQRAIAVRFRDSPFAPDFSTGSWQRNSRGIHRTDGLGENGSVREASLLVLTIGEDGSVTVLCGRATDQARPMWKRLGATESDSTRPVIFPALLLGLTHSALALAADLAQRFAGYNGSWDIGLRLTGIKHAIAYDYVQSGDEDFVQPYDVDTYERTATANTPDLLVNAASTAERIIAPLLRALTIDSRYLPYQKG